jgi:hypothetical protein
MTGLAVRGEHQRKVGNASTAQKIPHAISTGALVVTFALICRAIGADVDAD